ncbi:MAG: MT-A70 family methyltransferase [Pirellulaceae bacterium]|nr:MT-A70 family methyltransferase [Pirellulaceae bacterium]
MNEQLLNSPAAIETGPATEAVRGPQPSIARCLDDLQQRGHRFKTILADPPWRYENTASRAAAENHYSTMTVEEICNEPVSELVGDNAHLHLWTTNAFLESAFRVMRAWGFEFKSCMVWVKPTIGMGNYWRVSHEFCLLGIRGKLPFGRNDIPSWLEAPRTIHSRKPFAFRQLIEQVSPGPYLELYGRVEQPNTGWTVYGNQVERRLF